MLSPYVRVNSWAEVRDSVIFANANIKRNATLNRVILDKNVIVDEGVQIGIDHDYDRARGFVVSDSGVVVVPKGTHVTR